MDEQAFKEIISRLQAIGAAIAKLPPEIRATAFEMLRPYAVGGEAASASTHPSRTASNTASPENPNPSFAAAATADRETFFRAHDHGKAHENVKLIVADFYREYGCEPFNVADIESAAREVGVTVPDRIYMTLNAATFKGKKLFQRAGRGLFAPTVHGEGILKELYNVRKGTKTRPATPTK